MTKREHILLIILVMVASVSVFGISLRNNLHEIAECKYELEKYNDLLVKLDTKIESEINSETNESNIIFPEEKTLSSGIEDILADFKVYDIYPERYQVYDTKSVEFVLQCPARNFIDYICSIKPELHFYSLESFSIKNESSGVSVILKFSFNPCFIKNQVTVEKKEIYSLFRSAYKAVNNIQKKTIPSKIVEQKIENGTGKFIIIGKIKEADNIYYTYIKNKQTGKIYKLTDKDILEENDNYYIFLLNGNKTKIQR